MYDNSLSFTVVGSGATSTSFTVGTGTGRVLLVNAASKITAFTYAGVSMTKVIDFEPSINDGNQQHVNVWRLSDPATGANTLQATIGAGDNEVIGIVSYTGIDTTLYQPVEYATGYSNNGVSNTQVATLSSSITPTYDRSMVVMLTRGANSTQTFTAGTGTLRVSSASILSNTQGVIDNGTFVSPAASTTLKADWTSGSGYISNVILSLSPSKTGGLLEFFP